MSITKILFVFVPVSIRPKYSKPLIPYSVLWFFTDLKWKSQGIPIVDYTMTNIKNFKLSNIVGCVLESKVWKVHKFFRCVEARCKLS